MGIQNWSENIVVVDLPPEPEIADELRTITEMVRNKDDVDVVIDFSQVDIVASSSISALLRLRKLLSDCGHRLIFSNVAAATRGVFVTTGIEEIFEFVDDKFLALTSLQMVN